jgi:hypothetical protein
MEFWESLGRPPEKPFSGKFVVRIGPRLHRRLAAIAQVKGLSLNTLVFLQLLKLTRRNWGRPVDPTLARPESPAKGKKRQATRKTRASAG